MHRTLRALTLIAAVLPSLLAGLPLAAQTRPESPPQAAAAAQTQPASQPQTRPATTQAALPELAPVILAPPTSDEEIEQRLELVRAELAELTAAIPTASAPASQPEATAARTPAQQLHDTLTLYEAELLRWKRQREQLAMLRSDQAIEELAAQLKTWREQTEHYAGRRVDPNRYVDRSEYEELNRKYNQLNAELSGLTGRQATRDQQLTSLRKSKGEREQAVTRTLENLRTWVARLPDQLNEARAAGESRRLLLTKQALEWDHNLQLLRAAALSDTVAALELAQQQDADRIDVLSRYVQTLREYRNRVDRARVENYAEYAAEQLARSDLPEWKRPYWQIIQTAARGLRFFQELDDPTRSRFPQAAYDRLVARITRGRAYWDDFADSIDRRPGSAILAAYRRLGERHEQDVALLEELRGKLDITIDEQRAVLERQSQLFEEIDRLRMVFDEQMTALAGEDLVEARKLQAQLTGDLRTRLEERVEALTSEQQALRERLKSAVELVEGYSLLLASLRSEMYWTHLLVSERSLLKGSWKPAISELRGLSDPQSPAATRWAALRAELVRSLERITTAQWTTLALALGIAFLSSVIIRRRVTPWGGWADTDSLGFVGLLSLSRRVLAQLAELGRRRFAWILVLTVAPLAAWLSLDSRSVLAVLIYAVCGLLLGLLGSLAWIRVNFDVRRPHLRLIPCSDTKAIYHTRWLRRLVVAAAILLPVPMLLGAFDLLPETAALLKTLAVLVLLAITFVYVLSWQMFLNGVRDQSDRRGFWRSLAQMLYPAVPVFVVVLAGLEIAGYDALVTYLARASIVALLAVWVAVLCWMMLKERTRTADEKLSRALKTTETLKSTEATEIAPEPQQTHPVLVIGGQLLRVSVVLLAALVVLAAFGITPVEIRWLLSYPLATIGGRPVPVWRTIAAVFAIGAGLIVSRGIRAFLHAQVYPHSNVSRGAQAATNTLLHYSLIGLSLYAALLLLNIELGALVVLLGTLGLGLGLGLQPLFVNFISGLLILFERQIKVGDLVEVDTQLGEVTAISMRSTKIRTFDNVELDIPNAQFVTSKVVNWTLPDQKVRGKVAVVVSYDADEHLVRDLLLEIARNSPLVLRTPEPAVWFLNFGERGLEFELVAWFPNTSARWQFISTVRYEIRRVFREHHIEIPLPQRTLHLADGKPIAVQMVSNGDDGAPSEPPRPAGRKPQVARRPE